MYEDFFNLKANPFGVNPDPRFLFMTRHTTEALACMAYGIHARRGFVLLTGEVGTGKTTLINQLLRWLRQRHVPTAFLFNPRLDVPQFFEFMMADFGIQGDSLRKGELLLQLNHWLLERYRQGTTAVLIVDEAQNLSTELLEEIRMLTNLETSTDKLLQIVLSGQPELEVKLKDARLRQLRQRITLRCRTHPLTLEDTQSYITKRLHIAGANGNQIFTPEAINAVHRYASGIPRVINLLCDHALIGAFVDKAKSVSAEMVEAVARDFELDDAPAQLPRVPAKAENLMLMEALKTMTALADKLGNRE